MGDGRASVSSFCVFEMFLHRRWGGTRSGWHQHCCYAGWWPSSREAEPVGPRAGWAAAARRPVHQGGGGPPPGLQDLSQPAPHPACPPFWGGAHLVLWRGSSFSLCSWSGRFKSPFRFNAWTWSRTDLLLPALAFGSPLGLNTDAATATEQPACSAGHSPARRPHPRAWGAPQHLPARQASTALSPLRRGLHLELGILQLISLWKSR